MLPKESARMVLESLTGAYGALEGMTIHLAKEEPLVELDTLQLADITEADFDGYEEIADPEWEDPYIHVDDNAGMLSHLLEFEAGDEIDEPQTIYGMYIILHFETGGQKLFQWFSLPESITLANPGEKVQRKIDLLAADLPDEA